MKDLVEAMPEWLTHGFQVAGGIMPAVGFAMLLKVMLKKEFMPYLLIGFVISCFLTYSNLLPIALVGVALALISYNSDKDKAEMLAKIAALKSVNAEGDEEDGI
jgi:PTS system galactosamine-specific IIC component